MEVAIALMSFDRPYYLELVLQCLNRQIGFGRFVPRFYLFQDGAVSPRTGRAYADTNRIRESVDVFRDYMSTGTVVDGGVNLGVAMNFDRAERYLFEECRYDAVLFFEDDMILQPHYLETMAGLLELALENDAVGMFSAYGMRSNMPFAEQDHRRRELTLMNEHNWAFGITRKCWEARDRIVRGYLDLVRDIDYRDRKSRNLEIALWQRNLGRGGRGYHSSQDSIKNLACEALGIFRVSTVTNNARYIGRVGEHMSEDRFKARGYDETVMYTHRHSDFDLPGLDALRRMHLG